MDALSTFLQGKDSSVTSEAIVRLLSKKPGWKESNFQVSKFF